MIKLFRRIRQRLLDQKRFMRYLVYAAGEIVLVVLGILLALQVNNWNQNRKNKDLVRIRLTELVQDMELDAGHFQYHLDLAEAENHRIDSIRALLSVSTADQDVLMNIIKQGAGVFPRNLWVMIATTESPQLHQKAFLAIQNSGQLALFDNELQQSIGSFYGYHQKYAFMIEEIIKNKNIIHSNFVSTIPFEPNSEGSKLNPALLDELWSNVDRAKAQNTFVTLLNTFHELNLKTIFFNSMRLYKTQIMIDEMNAEIGSMGDTEVDLQEELD